MSSGQASVAADTLEFQLHGVNPNSLAVLTSADNALPQNPAHPCFGFLTGVSTSSLDGLRCIGGNLRRHRARVTDAFGTLPTPWGPNDPGGGLVAQLGLAPGVLAQFQVFYREGAALVCMTGLNTTNAYGVQIVP